MKYVLGLFVAFAGANAMAQQGPEVFSLSAATFVSKCTENVCGQGTTVIGPEVDIALDACTGVPMGYYSCSGTWTDTQTMDGFDFTSTITVTKTVMTPVTNAKVEAQVSYQITATTGPALSYQHPNSLTITLGQFGQVTDTVTLTGETLNINNGAELYIPSLTIAPVTVGPIPGPTPQPARR